MITRTDLVDVLFVIAPHSLLLDIAGPAEAFRLANQHRGRRGLPPRFRLRFAAPDPELVTSVGMTIGGLERLPESLPESTWVVVVGQPSEHVADAPPPRDGAGAAPRRERHGPLDEPPSGLGARRGHRAPPAGDHLFGHPPRRPRGAARRTALHHASRAAAGAAGAGAPGHGGGQPG